MRLAGVKDLGWARLQRGGGDAPFIGKRPRTAAATRRGPLAPAGRPLSDPSTAARRHGDGARGSRLWVRLQFIAFPARDKVTPRLAGFQRFGPMRMCSTASATAAPCASCTVIVTGQSCFRCQSGGGVKWQTAVRSVRALRR